MGQEDPLEKEMATHSTILAWTIQRSLVGCDPSDCEESDKMEQRSMDYHFTV